MKVLRFFILMLLFCELSSAQEKDMRGKEFWLTFPPNFHSGGQSSANLDSLIIFIISDSIANVDIEMRDANGIVAKRTLIINNPKQVFKTGVRYQNYELRGFKNYLNSGGNIDPFSSQTGKAAPQYFKVSSDQDISVTGLSNASLSADAFLSLPTDALGNDYIVMSYPNDTYSSVQANAFSPSQFAILATEDNTNVEITSSTNSYNFGTKKKSIILNKGESFLMQAELGGIGSKGDLTGSIVKSDKNIAVFSGHQRANIPIELANTNPSRNMILEQLIPTKYWGKNAYLIPFPKLLNNWDAYDVYRVVAKEDSTVLSINGIVIKTINKGEVYDAPLKDAISLEANSPISVAIFKQTSTDPNGSNINTSRIGDPSFILIPSKKQFVKIFNFTSLNTTQQDQFTGQNTPAFSSQYLTIVAPNNGLKTIKLDGQKIDSFIFDPIPNSEYSYFIAKINDGFHEIESDSNIMVYVHGYGEANAYGYFANMRINIFDKNIPRIHTKTEAFKMNGIATDTLEFDTGIYSFKIDSTSIVNCKITNDFKVVGTKLVNFSANLIDTVLDGSFDLIVTDSLQSPYRFKLIIPGKNTISDIDSQNEFYGSNFTCSPNPTSNELSLSYSLSNSEQVHLSLLNSIGMEVISLENSFKEQGNHTFQLNCSNYNLQNGIYFVSLHFGTNRYITKFTLAK